MNASAAASSKPPRSEPSPRYQSSVRAAKHRCFRGPLHASARPKRNRAEKASSVDDTALSTRWGCSPRLRSLASRACSTDRRTPPPSVPHPTPRRDGSSRPSSRRSRSCTRTSPSACGGWPRCAGAPLLRTTVFAALLAAAIDELAAELDEREEPAGTTIFRAGDPPDRCSSSVKAAPACWPTTGVRCAACAPGTSSASVDLHRGSALGHRGDAERRETRRAPGHRIPASPRHPPGAARAGGRSSRLLRAGAVVCSARLRRGPPPAGPDSVGADGTTAPGTTLDDDADSAAAPVSARGGCRRGRHVPEIAQRLFLGRRTVRMELASAIKLDLDSPAELASVLSEDSLERTAVL